MRPIKFRAWDKIKKRIVPVFGWHRFTGINIGDVDNARCNQYINDDDFELMQFTGLHDKNGKEIYEGDILEDREGMAVVYYNQPSFVCSDENNKIWVLGGGISGLNKLEYTEIIGNIYENPELLESK